MRPIPGFPEYYATHKGEIYHVKKMKLWLGSKGSYLQAAVKAIGSPIWSSQRVHRLVSAAFHGPCPLAHEVNHKNGDKKDNRPENLEYVTKSENQLHASNLGLNTRGPKLSASDVVRIREFLNTGVPIKRVAQMFSVSDATIVRIRKRSIWKHAEKSVELKKRRERS